MKGKTVLITGANSGLGRATAAELLRLGARVILGCRDRARAEEAAGQMRRELREAVGSEPEGAGELVIRELDLASLRSVRAFCQEMLQVWVRGRRGGEQGAEDDRGARPRGAGRWEGSSFTLGLRREGRGMGTALNSGFPWLEEVGPQKCYFSRLPGPASATGEGCPGSALASVSLHPSPPAGVNSAVLAASWSCSPQEPPIQHLT